MPMQDTERTSSMSDTYPFILHALDCAINGQSLKETPSDFLSLEQTVIENQLLPFLYPVIKAILPETKVVQWKQASLQWVFRNMALFEGAKKVVSLFEQAGIDSIWLKGAYIRSLFPVPQLRTMCDIDILVKEEHLPQVETLLTNTGYKISQQKNQDGTVYSIHGDDGTFIELHTCVVQPNEFIYSKTFINPWRDCVRNYHVTPVGYFLNEQDNFLHAVAHLGKHLEHHGVGIRYLCDIAVLVKAYRETLDWIATYEKLKQIGLDSLTNFLLGACSTYLHVDIPNAWPMHEVSNAYLESFVNLLIQCGTYGSGVSRNQLTSRVRRARGSNNTNKFLFFIMESAFPTRYIMSAKYQYLVRIPILLPWSWLCRIFTIVFRIGSESNRNMESVLEAKRLQSQEDALFRELGLSSLFPK